MPSFPDINTPECVAAMKRIIQTEKESEHERITQSLKDVMRGIRKKRSDRKRELLADIEHEQWVYWSTEIASEIEALRMTVSAFLECKCSTVPSEKSRDIVEDIGAIMVLLKRTKDRLDRWETLQKTAYADLPESEKEHDRVWADMSLDALDQDEDHRKS